MGLLDDFQPRVRTSAVSGKSNSLLSDFRPTERPSFRETLGNILTSPGTRSVLSTVAQATPFAGLAPLISHPREIFETLATPKVAERVAERIIPGFRERPGRSFGEKLVPLTEFYEKSATLPARAQTFTEGMLGELANIYATPISYAVPKAAQIVGGELLSALPRVAQKTLATPLSKLKTRNPQAVANDILKSKTFDEALSKWKNVQEDLTGKVGRILFRKDPNLIIRFTRGEPIAKAPLTLPTPAQPPVTPTPIAKVTPETPVAQILSPQERLSKINGELLSRVKVLESLRKRKNIDSDFVKNLILEEQGKIKSLLDEQKSIIVSEKQKDILPSALEAGLKRKGEVPSVVILPTQEVSPVSVAPVSQPSQVTPAPIPSPQPVEPAKVIPQPTVPPVAGTGETVTRGLSLGVQEKAIENKLTEGFGSLPEFQQVNMADQAKRVSDLLKQDPDLGRRVVMGLEPSPKDILPESFFVAVEDQAVRQGDVSTLFDLATKSPLTQEATTMGQRIRALSERDPESPVAAIKSIARTREGAVKAKVKDTAKAKKQISDTIRKEVARVRPSRETWASFVSSLECK